MQFQPALRDYSVFLLRLAGTATRAASFSHRKGFDDTTVADYALPTSDTISPMQMQATTQELGVRGEHATPSLVQLLAPPGATTINFSLRVRGDRNTEGRETIELSLEEYRGAAWQAQPRGSLRTVCRSALGRLYHGEPSGYRLGARATHRVTITDSPPAELPVVSFSSAAAVSSEGASSTLTLSASPAPAGTLPVRLRASGDAVAGTDYTVSGAAAVPGDPNTFALSLGPGNPGTVTVTLVDDQVHEAEETVVLELQAGAGYAVGTPLRHRLAVRDNDPAPPRARFSTLGSTVPEGGSVRIGVRVSPPPAAGATLSLRLRAMAGGGVSDADYSVSGATPVSGSPGTFDLSVGASGSGEFTVAVSSDTLREQEEEVRFVLLPPASGGYALGAPLEHRLRMPDRSPQEQIVSQRPLVSFEGGSLRGFQSALPGERRSFRVRVHPAPAPGTIVRVPWKITSPSQRLVYPVASLVQGFSCKLEDPDCVVLFRGDADVMSDHLEGVVQQSAGSSGYSIPAVEIGSTGVGEFTLRAPDGLGSPVVLQLMFMTPAYIEGGNPVPAILPRLPDRRGMVPHALASAERTARELEIVASNAPTTTANFSSRASELREGGSVEVPVVFSPAPVSGTTTFLIEVIDINYNNPLADIASFHGITINGQRALQDIATTVSGVVGADGRGMLVIDYPQDTGLNASPVLRLSILGATDFPVGEQPHISYVAGPVFVHNVTLLDDDKPVIGFLSDSSYGREGFFAGIVELPISISPSFLTTTEVRVLAAPEGSTADSYDYSMGRLLISSGSSYATLRVTVRDDALVEAEERVVLRLQEDPQGRYELGTRRQNTLTIADNDRYQVGFARAASLIAESVSGPAGVVVTVVPASPAPLSIPVQVAGTATEVRLRPQRSIEPQGGPAQVTGAATETASGDYLLTGLSAEAPRLLTIPAGHSSALIGVTPIDDDRRQGSRTVSFALGAPGAGASYVVADGRAAHEATILDDESAAEPRSVAFEELASEATEGAAAAMVTVRATPAPTGNATVSVRLRVLEGSGVTADDYNLAGATADGPGRYRVAVGAGGVQLQVTAADDALDEWTESLDLVLEPSGQDYIIGAARRHRVRLRDTDIPEVGFVAGSSRIAEPGQAIGIESAVDLVVEAVPAPAGDLVIPVGVVAARTTAEATDYSLGTLTIPGGSRTGTLRVTALADRVVEFSDEDLLMLELRSVGGGLYAVDSERAQYALQFYNAVELPVVRFANRAIFVEEDGGAQSIALEITPPLPMELYVAIEVGGLESRKYSQPVYGRDYFVKGATVDNYIVRGRDVVQSEFGVVLDGTVGYSPTYSLSLRIPPGVARAAFALHPIDDAEVEPLERVDLILRCAAYGYRCYSSRGTAIPEDSERIMSLFIRDSDAPEAP